MNKYDASVLIFIAVLLMIVFGWFVRCDEYQRCIENTKDAKACEYVK